MCVHSVMYVCMYVLNTAEINFTAWSQNHLFLDAYPPVFARVLCSKLGSRSRCSRWLIGFSGQFLMSPTRGAHEAPV